jgi:hypothetical protein
LRNLWPFEGNDTQMARAYKKEKQNPKHMPPFLLRF